jgi:hypothetical protein
MLMSTATAAQASNDESITDELGTHASSEVNMPSGVPRSGICGNSNEYGGGFQTNLGANWSDLAARSGLCRAGQANGSWGIGSLFYVSRETNGEFICRSRLDQMGTDVWFKTDKDYSWSGGTSDGRWQYGTNGTCRLY